MVRSEAIMPHIMEDGMRKIRIFLLGMFEFRSMLTSHFDYPEIDTYDWGREYAHRLTFRLFENHC
jgi:hypothetical protein